MSTKFSGAAAATLQPFWTLPKTTTKNEKRAKLERAGWKFGSAYDFLNLTDEEIAYVEMKIALSETLRQRRRENKLTQTELAKLVQSSQSRIAKMEAGDPSVSIDLLIKSLLALGVSRKELARALS